MNINFAVKRGRPPASAANDNTDAYAKRAEQVRALRAQGLAFRDIADRLALDVKTVWSSVNLQAPKRKPAAANDNRREVEVAVNGGCSTTSGMQKVRLARVPTLDKPEIYPELAVPAERMAA